MWGKLVSFKIKTGPVISPQILYKYRGMKHEISLFLFVLGRWVGHRFRLLSEFAQTLRPICRRFSSSVRFSVFPSKTFLVLIFSSIARALVSGIQDRLLEVTGNSHTSHSLPPSWVRYVFPLVFPLLFLFFPDSSRRGAPGGEWNSNTPRLTISSAAAGSSPYFDLIIPHWYGKDTVVGSQNKHNSNRDGVWSDLIESSAESIRDHLSMN